ncbi:MAG: hypothetical protein HYU48_00305 [Candidatus Levybacteria bacterium]|nr:hypothetical protein [Candidatus Levybacteria bacterium]
MRRVAMAGVLAIALGPVVRITPKEHAPVLPKPLKIVSPLGNRSRGK